MPLVDFHIFARRHVPIVCMWPKMVVPSMGVTRDSLEQLLFVFVSVLIQQLRFHCVEVSLHDRIVIWTPRPAHTLSDPVLTAKLDKLLRGELAPSVAVQDLRTLSAGCLDRLLQCVYRQLRRDLPATHAGYHAPVVQVYDRAIVPHGFARQGQIGEVHAPCLIAPARHKVLLEQVIEGFVRSLSLHIPIPFLLPRYGPQAQFLVHISVYRHGT